MDDSNGNNGLPPGGSEQSLSESPSPESIISDTTTVETMQPVPTPANGSSPRKIVANRSNAKKSTGPKTAAGKRKSSWNSTRHGLLSKRVFAYTAKEKKQFARLLGNLQQDLQPVGTLEVLLVEKIAYEYWRLGAAAFFEFSTLSEGRPFWNTPIERVVKYQSTANRQLYQAINELERLQRLRQGDSVPAPVSVQVFHDGLPLPDKEGSGQ